MLNKIMTWLGLKLPYKPVGKVSCDRCHFVIESDDMKMIENLAVLHFSHALQIN